jgi:hypothetical protein
MKLKEVPSLDEVKVSHNLTLFLIFATLKAAHTI